VGALLAKPVPSTPAKVPVSRTAPGHHALPPYRESVRQLGMAAWGSAFWVCRRNGGAEAVVRSRPGDRHCGGDVCSSQRGRPRVGQLPQVLLWQPTRGG
jgi:hypothetical protein